MTGPQLSDRELQVLQRAAQGEIYDRIAADWGVTGRTVKQVASRLFGKLGARSMPHAVFIACQLKILEPNRRHGDHAGFAAHKYRGEDPWACTQGCPEGERAYRAEQRQRRRQEATGRPQGASGAVDGARDVRGATRAARSRTVDSGEEAA